MGRCFVRPFNEFNNLPELQALPRIQFSIKWMEMEEGANSNQKNGLHFCMPLAIAAQLNLPFDHATKDSVSADFVLPNTKFMRLIVLVSVLLVLHAPIYCHCHHIGIHFVSFFFVVFYSFWCSFLWKCVLHWFGVTAFSWPRSLHTHEFMLVVSLEVCLTNALLFYENLLFNR